ncbi:MAG: hypothetical protein RMM08_00110 [Armatimonadota bacterium]|nr:hypothetical protein [Armatimonadota bacterium]
MTVNDVSDLIKILKEHPDWRDELRRVLLTEELLQLPSLVRELVEVQQQQAQEIAQIRAILAEVLQVQKQHSEILAQHSESISRLIEAQRRTDERLEQLAEAQRRTDERLEQLAEEVRALAEAQRRTEQVVQRLETWQRGEAGRREGEQYEQHTVRRAPSLFFGGEGGSPGEPHIRKMLTEWLSPIYQQRRAPEPGADPLLADIIWWKGKNVLVVEVSQKVNGQDVRRARQRADTLREMGVNAVPVVIGEEWAAPESQAIAQQEGVDWMVGGGLSQGFLQFRQLPADASNGL